MLKGAHPGDVLMICLVDCKGMSVTMSNFSGSAVRAKYLRSWRAREMIQHATERLGLLQQIRQHAIQLLLDFICSPRVAVPMEGSCRTRGQFVRRTSLV